METHPKQSVTGCELPSICLKGKGKNDMQMWRLPADFWTVIEKGLHHLPSDLKESTSPTLPFQISVNPIRNQLQAAFKEKNSIKETLSRDACPTGGSNSPPHMSGQKN
jgi:hypothetical protein